MSGASTFNRLLNNMAQITVLVAGKFLTLVIQLFLTFIVIQNREDNINNSKNPASEARSSLTACIVLSLLCQFFELISLFTGITIFFYKFNVFSITFQSLGVLFTSWFLLGSWPSELLWPIWFFGALIPFIFEILILTSAKKLYSPPIYIEIDQDYLNP
jgi:hypothetical protein